MQSARIFLVAEGDPFLQTIATSLQQQGHQVQAVTEAGALRADQPDLFLLPWPDSPQNGTALCRSLRGSYPRSGLLVVSGQRSEEAIVQSLDAGADDHLVRPFGLPELRARIGALLRRRTPADRESNSTPFLASAQRDLVLDLAQRSARIGERTIPLARKEFDLLYFLAQQPGRVWRRSELLYQVWEHTVGVSSRTVDVHIRWLREKIEEDPAHPQLLITVRGVGYRFDP